nr:hypothetical protein [Tessaracoccus coleopterorum]
MTALEAAALADVAEPNVVLILAGTPDTRALISGASPARTQHDEPVVGQLTNSQAARRHADQIDGVLGVASIRYDGPASELIPRAWPSAT